MHSQQPPNPARRVRALWGILIAFGAVVVVGVVAWTALNNHHTPKPTVGLTDCRTDGSGITHIKFRVGNRDDRVHSYTVHLTVGRHPTNPGTLVGVQPGETATGEIVASGTGQCEITSVDQQ